MDIFHFKFDEIFSELCPFISILPTLHKVHPCFSISMGSHTVYIYKIYSWIECTLQKKVVGVILFYEIILHISEGCDHPNFIWNHRYISIILYFSIYYTYQLHHFQNYRCTIQTVSKLNCPSRPQYPKTAAMSQNLFGAFRKQLTIRAIMGQKADSISGSNFYVIKSQGFSQF